MDDAQRLQPRDRILDAALRLGSAASLRQLGAAAGLHNSSLFHHFDSKRGLHDALAERVVGAARQRLVPPLQDRPPRLEGLLAGLGDLAEHLAQRPAEAAWLTRALAGAELHGHDRVTDQLLRPLWEWLLRAREAKEIRPVRPQPATLQLMGLVLLEPAFDTAPRGGGLRPATRARRREIEAWVRGTLARR